MMNFNKHNKIKIHLLLMESRKLSGCKSKLKINKIKFFKLKYFLFYFRESMINSNVKSENSWSKLPRKRPNYHKSNNFKSNIIRHNNKSSKRKNKNNRDLLAIKPILINLFNPGIANSKNYNYSNKNIIPFKTNKIKTFNNYKLNYTKLKNNIKTKIKPGNNLCLELFNNPLRQVKKDGSKE